MTTALLILLAILAAIPITFYARDKSYRYERSIEVDVAPDTLFEFIVDMKSWELFYPNTLVARYNDNEQLQLGSKSVEKYWGLSGYHVFLHEVTALSKPTLIQWTGQTIYGGLLILLFLWAVRHITGVFSYRLEPFQQGKKVRWTRTCSFSIDSNKIHHIFVYIYYMPIFRLELMRALKIYQELCKNELERRALASS